MTATTVDRGTPRRDGRTVAAPMEATTKIPGGVMAQINAAGNMVNAVATAANKTVGVPDATIDNSAGVAGAITGEARRGVFRFFNSAAGDQITRADYGASCYVVDNQTVAKTSNSNARPVAGTIRDVDADGVWVEF